MDTRCEWRDCKVVTHRRFCSQACREKWQYHCKPGWKEKKNARNKNYATTHPEVSSRAQKKWYDNGGKAVRDAWRAANRERFNELVREWARAHPEVINKSNRTRRARLAQAEGSFTLQEWYLLCAFYQYKCARCGKPEQHADHVVPLSKGGTNTIDNIQPLCRSCNSTKGVTTTDYR